VSAVDGPDSDERGRSSLDTAPTRTEPAPDAARCAIRQAHFFRSRRHGRHRHSVNDRCNDGCELVRAFAKSLRRLAMIVS